MPHKPGNEVGYCHEGNEVSAQVTEVHPDNGEVLGIACFAVAKDVVGNVVSRTITHGVQKPTPATTADHRKVHGHFWAK